MTLRRRAGHFVAGGAKKARVEHSATPRARNHGRAYHSRTSHHQRCDPPFACDTFPRRPELCIDPTRVLSPPPHPKSSRSTLAGGQGHISPILATSPA